ncbi:MAG: TIGR02680 family protein [Burkholderiales bacterium]|nr:TIGR02680 family protein [Burkholderiales bacterium]
MRLPADGAGLDRVDDQLRGLDAALHALAGAARLLAAALGELERQRERGAEAAQRRAEREQQLALRLVEHEEARTRLAALEATHGDDVQALKKRIAHTRALVERIDAAGRKHGEALRLATEARARAEQRHADAESAYAERSGQRTAQVERWQAYAATGLLASALPEGDAAMPDTRTPWTIEPALTLARRTEQALADLDDGDERWKRVQAQLSEDLTELQRTLGALGHQAASEPNDFGLAVHVYWHQQPERPERVAALLAAEVDARQGLLSAREREVLENHLQAEIASQIQRLMRGAEAQTRSVNAELHKRPTGTGVRFRLQWQALPEGEGAPAGLDAARERLLATRSELWSAEDRRIVGALLQQRIQDQRAADALDAEGTLLEQLAAALDYRRWHRFRVERLQDGQWRRLSGPASSGERALGLTVPLFAAIASFYRERPLAPRLMMLDEAFAGIDDAARAHCMGLVHEFDLDFVITSEREWGCYATLPGVAICQLQRREGIDAVFVSRWHWDGSARRREADPARRFPAAETT